jgi:raffinose/stachyose/melibiose transport system permease protein
LPKEIFEAARVDGASDLMVYRTILVPMLKPGIATVAVFTALSAWNEFLLALVYIQNDDLKTIPTGLLTFSTRYSTNYHLLFAALTIVTIPMIIVYVIFNRKVIAGLTEGAVK